MEDEVKLTVKQSDDGSLWAPIFPDKLKFEHVLETPDGYTPTVGIDIKYHPPILGEKGDKRLILNPDVDKVVKIVNKIRENNGYCPSQERTAPGCMLVKDTRCPCPDMMIHGRCKCGLFIATDLIPKKEDSDGRSSDITE